MPPVLLGIPWSALGAPLRNHFWKKKRRQPYWGGENSGNALERSNALNYRVWGIPAVLLKGIPGKLWERFQGLSGIFPEFPPESPSRTGGMRPSLWGGRHLAGCKTLDPSGGGDNIRDRLNTASDSTVSNADLSEPCWPSPSSAERTHWVPFGLLFIIISTPKWENSLSSLFQNHLSFKNITYIFYFQNYIKSELHSSYNLDIFENPTGSPDPRSPKTPQQRKKKFKKNENPDCPQK